MLMLNSNRIRGRNRGTRVIISGVLFLTLLLTACQKDDPQQPFTIGVVSYVSVLNPVIEGFKAGMAAWPTISFSLS